VNPSILSEKNKNKIQLQLVTFKSH